MAVNNAAPENKTQGATAVTSNPESVIIQTLQQARDTERRPPAQPPRRDEQSGPSTALARRRRHWLAGIACASAAATAVPGIWQQLVAAPSISWVLAAVGIYLLWPRNA